MLTNGHIIASLDRTCLSVSPWEGSCMLDMSWITHADSSGDYGVESIYLVLSSELVKCDKEPWQMD